MKVIPSRRSSIDLSHIVRVKEEESLSDNFKCRTHARLPYVPRFRDQSVSSLREERAEILVATSWATSREKSYRISMPRCLPTSAAEWIPGVSGEGAASTSSARLRRNSWEIPDLPNFLGKPRRDGTAPPSPRPVAAAREISRRNLGLRFYLHTRVSSSLALLSIHTCSHAQRRNSGGIRTSHT